MSVFYNGYGRPCPAFNGGIRGSLGYSGLGRFPLGYGYGGYGGVSRIGAPLLGGSMVGGPVLGRSMVGGPVLGRSMVGAPLGGGSIVGAHPFGSFVSPKASYCPVMRGAVSLGCSQIVAPTIPAQTNVQYEDVPFERNIVELQPVTRTIQDSYTVEHRQISVPQTTLQPVTQYVPVQSLQPAVQYQQYQQQFVHPPNSPVSLSRKAGYGSQIHNNFQGYSGPAYGQPNVQTFADGQSFAGQQNPLFSANNLQAPANGVNMQGGNSRLFNTLK